MSAKHSSLTPEKALSSLVDVLHKALDKDSLALALEDLLTPAEIVTIAERIQILRMLRAGKTQRAIAQELGISITTVTRGSKSFQKGN